MIRRTTATITHVPPGQMTALARFATVAKAQAVLRMPLERRMATLLALVHDRMAEYSLGAVVEEHPTGAVEHAEERDLVASLKDAAAHLPPPPKGDRGVK